MGNKPAKAAAKVAAGKAAKAHGPAPRKVHKSMRKLLDNNRRKAKARQARRQAGTPAP